jgi:hypothetical protein
MHAIIKINLSKILEFLSEALNFLIETSFSRLLNSDNPANL